MFPETRSSFKPAIVLPDGVGARNFLLTDFLRQISHRGRAHIWHVLPDECLSAYKYALNGCLNGSAEWHLLGRYDESASSLTLRHCLAYAQMYWADTRSMRYQRSMKVIGSWRRRALHRTARSVGRVASTPLAVDALARLHLWTMGHSSEVQRLRLALQETSPSVIFFSHQRPPGTVPLALAARSLGLPTATFIFSWDNLTSKGRIAAPFDHYLVWSDQMRRELLRYYPDVSEDRVHIVGTPQFDPYVDRSLLWSREEFFEKIGADPGRPLLCYSGGDTGTCPEEPQHVRVLMELVRKGKIRGNPQVLLRPAPVDDGLRYQGVRYEYPELIYARPAWVHTAPDDWTRVIPLPEDVQFLANLTQHADLNINVASTMTLDFAIHDKPVVNIAFDVAEPPPFGVPLWDFFYQFEHYRPVVELGAARFARGPEELAQHVNIYLANPALDREGRRRLVDLEVGVPLGQSSRRIIEVLEAIGRR